MPKNKMDLELRDMLDFPPCPSGCGCRHPDDPDQRECACDGPCTQDGEWPYYGRDVTPWISPDGYYGG